MSIRFKLVVVYENFVVGRLSKEEGESVLAEMAELLGRVEGVGIVWEAKLMGREAGRSRKVAHEGRGVNETGAEGSAEHERSSS